MRTVFVFSVSAFCIYCICLFSIGRAVDNTLLVLRRLNLSFTGSKYIPQIQAAPLSCFTTAFESKVQQAQDKGWTVPAIATINEVQHDILKLLSIPSFMQLSFCFYCIMLPWTIFDEFNIANNKPNEMELKVKVKYATTLLLPSCELLLIYCRFTQGLRPILCDKWLTQGLFQTIVLVLFPEWFCGMFFRPSEVLFAVKYYRICFRLMMLPVLFVKGY